MLAKQKLATFLHLLFCTERHTTDILMMSKPDGACKFLLEEQLSDAWIQKDHIRWIDETDKFLVEIGLPDSETALYILTECIKLSNKLRELLTKYPNLRPLLTTLKMLG